MKTIITLLAIILGSSMYAQTQKSGTITATVTNVKGTEGKVLFGLYSEDNFMVSAPVSSETSGIKHGIAKVSFENIPAGTYAIVVLHDKNNNERMDFDSQGMPEENYGTSGTMSYGPPSWVNSKFEFDGNKQELEIRF